MMCSDGLACGLVVFSTSELTDLESDSQLEILTEVPGAPDQTIVDGWFKFRDNKRVRLLL